MHCVQAESAIYVSNLWRGIHVFGPVFCQSSFIEEVGSPGTQAALIIYGVQRYWWWQGGCSVDIAGMLLTKSPEQRIDERWLD
jgi:hypothetical protein